MPPIELVPDDFRPELLFKPANISQIFQHVNYEFEKYDHFWWMPYYFTALGIILLIIIVNFAMSGPVLRSMLFGLTGSQAVLKEAEKLIIEQRPKKYGDRFRELEEYDEWENLMEAYSELKKLKQYFINEID
ncbi:hypothetical protein T02_12504 [Trichinella nativa]|uniref:Uncharacterized protein n=3 Tax=Trichinella TaxID=6333 RepID=A0A0V1LSR9_9BILA|nr:hypothetical protein T05_8818 [Trichinella murrelli]KRX55228.1 hypothetical protein T09_13497 [Trichinella sp. T9]KRX72765.1 hypothetical protein T06_9086 [Trichinella sp. T6]KRY60258.1 hypothetical protein T03_2897 [Trichinella britovi]KRZ62481.1 hypothetical protein T02_12504 [Trichinella nativa]KRZ95246.1 hypothetical protein T08_6579 [Trichinella sp. T8]